MGTTPPNRPGRPEWSQPPHQQAPPPSSDPLGGLIPTKNPTALTAYYLGIFSLIPCIALILGPLAVVLGILGLKAHGKNPAVRGKGHAIAGIVIGGFTTVINLASIAYLLVLYAAGTPQ